MTKTSTPEGAIARGRQKTDKSLDAERVRTDGTMESRRGRVEVASDRSIGQGRDAADSKVVDSRRAADAALRADRSNGRLTVAEERRRSDARTRSERASADRAATLERRMVDATRASERAEIESSRKNLFLRERGATDRDLASERTLSDLASERAAEFLTREVGQHLHTREALALRDEFLHLLSRDLKVPMLAIAAAADRLRQNAHHVGADDEDREKVEIISRSSQEVLRLIGDLLERVAVWQESTRRRRDYLSAADKAANRRATKSAARSLAGKPAKKAKKRALSLNGRPAKGK